MDRLELTENPAILFEKDIHGAGIKVLGLQLFDNCNLLNIESVDSITLEKPPTGVTELFEGDGESWHYMLHGQKLKFTFEDRFQSVITYGGCLHLKNQISVAIDAGMIVGIWVYCTKHDLYPDIKKEEIQILFGKADKIEESYFEEDDCLASTQFIFEKRLLTLVFNDYSDKKIDALFLGKFPFMLSRTKNNR